MATTASGELQNYHHNFRRHHQQHHQSKHNSYNPYFTHHSYGASKPRFSENDSSPEETLLSSENKETSLPRLTINDKRISQDLEKKKCSQSFLPPIGDALLRRDHFKESSQQSSPSRSDENNAFVESKLMLKLPMKRSENNADPPSDDAIQSRISGDEKKNLIDVVGESSLNFSIKSEGSSESMIHHLSSRNLSVLVGREPEDLNIVAIDSSIPGSVENFFRSEQNNLSGSEFTHTPVNHDAPPSYTTLTPLQPLPSVSTVSEKYLLGGGGAYPLMQKDTNESSYNKIGGMGHSLPPLSNRILLSSLAAQSRGEMQTQDAIDAVNHVAAAVNLTHYNKVPVLPSTIISQPPSHLTPSTASYEDQVLSRLNHHNSMSPAFQGGQIFPHRNRFSPPYSHSMHELPNTLQNECHDKRPTRVRQDEFIQERRKSRASSDRITNATQNNFSQSSRTQQIDEVNTKAVADQITAELKRCSIPQAVFARKVLSRSQGTLSDLLRNPKPWSKLKSGRETFRKMWKWLQEPSPYRVQQLRAEGTISDFFFTQ